MRTFLYAEQGNEPDFGGIARQKEKQHSMDQRGE